MTIERWQGARGEKPVLAENGRSFEEMRTLRSQGDDEERAA